MKEWITVYLASILLYNNFEPSVGCNKRQKQRRTNVMLP